MAMTSLIIIFFTILSKFLGFFREIILAKYYGVSGITDIYLMGFIIPGVIFSFIGISITAAFIPIYKELILKNKYLAYTYYTDLKKILMFISTIFIVFLYFSAPSLVLVFNIETRSPLYDEAILFMRIMGTSVFLSLYIHLTSALQNSHNIFIWPVIAGIPFNVIIIASIILSSNFSIYILPAGVIVGLLVQSFIQFLITRINIRIIKVKSKMNFSDKNLALTLKLTLPLVLGVSLLQLNILFDRYWASHIQIGGISAINYASKLNDFTLGIFILSILTILFPKFIELFLQENYKKANKVLNNILSLIALFIIPISVYIFFFSTNIVEILYGSDNITSNDLQMIVGLLKFYTLGLVIVAFREVLVKIYYAHKNTILPMLTSLISLIINIILTICLSSIIGIPGIALATTISLGVNLILLMILLKKLENRINLKLKKVSLITAITFSYSLMAIYLTSNLSLIYQWNSSFTKLIVITTVYSLIILIYLFIVLVLYRKKNLVVKAD